MMPVPCTYEHRAIRKPGNWKDPRYPTGPGVWKDPRYPTGPGVWKDPRYPTDPGVWEDTITGQILNACTNMFQIETSRGNLVYAS